MASNSVSQLKSADHSVGTFSLSNQSQCAIVALVITAVAAVIIATLGSTTDIFGSVGSTEFYASVAGGGSVAAIAIASIIAIAISNGNAETARPRRVNLERPYSELGQAAIDFAMEELAKHPEAKPIHFGGSNWHQPVNRDISKLSRLYGSYYSAFATAIQKHQNDPWTKPEVIEAADAFLKIGFAISCLTLEDLEAFTEELRRERTWYEKLFGEVAIDRSYAQALSAQDSYSFRTIMYCAQNYHDLRGEIGWAGDRLGYTKSDYGVPQSPTQQLYYQEGTMQHGWRVLYNEFCDRLRVYVPESAPDEHWTKRIDERFLKWTQKDEGAHTFSREPSTLPT